MKILIILATALLVPVMMKFQERTLLDQSNPKTARRIMAILTEGGVSSPEVSVQYLEATVGGMVESEQKAQGIVEEVRGLRGVSEVKSQLVVEGWFRLARSKLGIIASGVVTPEWKAEVLAGQPEMDVSQLKTRPHLRLRGRSSVSWGLFADRFFQLKGAKRLTFLGTQLTAEGEVLPSEIALLRQESRTLGADVIFDSRMAQRASHFHFKGRSLDSPIEGEPLRRLTPQLSEKKVAFETGEHLPSEAGRQTLNDLVVILLESPSEAAFIVGCYPDDREMDLAGKRAQHVRDALVKAGVSKKN